MIVVCTHQTYANSFPSNHFGMKFRILLITFFIGSVSLTGQNRFSFVDAITGEPVPYVHVIFGDHEGKYSDEEGIVTLPDSILTARISHISYEPMSMDITLLRGPFVALTPAVSELRPAIVMPNHRKSRTIGYASKKGVSSYGGKNGFALAEFFGYQPDWTSPLVTAISLNLNTFNIKRAGTSTVDGERYTDGVTHIAKLRVDLRSVDPGSGGPGGSLIGGGVIYTFKDRININMHKLCKVSLPEPAVFPEEGLFVVVEWIVTDDVKVQDFVTPSIWRTRTDEGSSSWYKWPVGTPWKRLEKSQFDDSEKVFCISLELLE